MASLHVSIEIAGTINRHHANETLDNELVDMQQNVYNVGYDLANILAIAGVGLDGDLVGTTKLSIGCDA